MKHKHHLCHKAVPVGEPSALYLGKRIQCLCSSAAVSEIINITKQYGENTAVLRHTSVLHDFPKPAKQSRYQANGYLRASELITQPYVQSHSPSTFSTQSCANTNCTVPKPPARRTQKKPAHSFCKEMEAHPASTTNWPMGTPWLSKG